VPTVSIITPTLSRIDFLRRALDSALAQTYDDFECVVVVDGPSPELAAYVSSHPDPRVRLVQRAENGGVAVARNTGIAEARGRYVGFLDDDDIWLPRKLERQVPLLDAGADVVHSLVYVADGDGNVYDGSTQRGFALFRAAAAEGFPYLRLLRQSSYQISSFLVRKTAIEAIGGFDPSLTTIDDLDFVHRLWRNYTLAFVDEPLTKYCIHDSAWSLTRDPDVWRRFAEKELSWIADNHPPEWREAEAYLYMQIAQAYWIGGRYRATVKPTLRARRRDPSALPPRQALKYLAAALLPKVLVDTARRRTRHLRPVGEPDPWLDLPGEKTTGIASESATNA
jgi:glycosyltransferase involved in cell wall biosynthesis